MKILVVTQAVDQNHEVLGFFHGWLEEFAKHYEKITVICLQEGKHVLPKNIEVFSLGKEKKRGRFLYLLTFFRLIIAKRGSYDVVFVHMNPIYVVLVGWWWRLQGKPIFLWYTHRAVNWKLRIASWFVNLIFTAAEESLRLSTPKKKVIGHGIDTSLFSCPLRPPSLCPRIIHVGRISPIKNCDILIEAAKILKEIWQRPFLVEFIGKPITESDHAYAELLQKRVKEYELMEEVIFSGGVSNLEVKNKYCSADLSVNLTPTGGIDKAVLESMSCGLPVLTSNTAFAPYFDTYRDKLLFEERNARDLAEKIMQLIENQALRERVSDFIVIQAREKASVGKVIGAMASIMMTYVRN